VGGGLEQVEGEMRRFYSGHSTTRLSCMARSNNQEGGMNEEGLAVELAIPLGPMPMQTLPA
jgi:hypothetical protein